LIPGNEMEPTPRAGPCLEEIFPGLSLEELHQRLVNTEHNYVEFLLYQDNDLMVTLLAFIDFDCFRVEGLRVRGCKERQEEVIKLIGEPEAAGGDIERECAEARIPAEPPYRVLRTLKKLELENVKPLAYRIVGLEEVSEIWPLEESGLE
jgi:hypothetical protein